MTADDTHNDIVRVNGKIVKSKGSNMKHKTLAAALNAAQKNIGAAKKGSANPFFKSKYADLGSVIEAVKEALNEEGLSIVQPINFTFVANEGKTTVLQILETIIIHESGEEYSSRAVLPTLADIQKQGAAITYMRRFALQSLLLVPAEDLDGNDIVKGEKPVAAEPAQPKSTKPKPSFLKGS